MLKLLQALKYRAMIMAIVQFVEHTLPDDMPGVRKLDIALKELIRLDAGVEKMVPEVTLLIGMAKGVYNAAKAEFSSQVEAP
jgi:hypothetical protein